jgi:hypothetical protein
MENEVREQWSFKGSFCNGSFNWATDKLQTGTDWGDGRKQRREKMNRPDVFFTVLLLLVH